MSYIRFLIAALLTVGMAAAHAPSAAAQTPTADEKALSTYTLTMPTVRKVAAATQKMGIEAAAQEARDPKKAELRKLKTRMDALQEKEEMTEAEEAEVEKLIERMQALEEEIDASEDEGDSNNETLADMEAVMKKNPAAMRILASEGLTPREYTLCLMALFQAALAEGFSQGKLDLDKLPAGINPANIRFVREHKAELEALQKQMGAAPKK